MDLPTAVLAYKVLKNGYISVEKYKLVRSIIVSLTYKNTKKQLKAIYDSSTSALTSNIWCQIRASIIL